MIVFQDLTLHAGTDGRTRLREALLECVAEPWRHEPDRERETRSGAPTDDVIVFEREAGDGVEAAGLVLWSRNDTYAVVNILPRKVRELGHRSYNAALGDFVTRVVEPASRRATFRIEITSAEQSLENWLPEVAAAALRRFSAASDKGTRLSHPSDQRRWYDLLISVHLGQGTLETGHLRRWLIEEEGWPEDRADRLAAEYAFGLALLSTYDLDRA